MERRCVSVNRLGLLAAMVLTLLCLGMGTDKTAHQGLPPGFRQLMEAPPEEREAVQRLLGVNYQMADLSLSKRENVDFILTPALLVQEAVSDGVVLTYPEE
jgi:hypothetical protein